MKLLAVIVPFVCSTSFVASAHASPQWIANEPAQRPPFAFEIEPHLLVATSGPPGGPAGQGYGLGIRGNFVLREEGFSSDLNDIVALGVGVQLMRYNFNSVILDHCRRFETAPDGVTRVCVDVGGSTNGDNTLVFMPVVLHWSVFLTRQVSVLVEAGLNPYLYSGQMGLGSTFSLGARIHLDENHWLVVRLGAPTASVGLSLPF